ncbi:hypothetical protein AWH62_00840 [Maricaulis sp. W15]|uniref:hypothetical protein n=1 Tax=Maricaulis sp. W15 TaxID=1772333 RepID=UPI0009490158|nr:hypothetical protein [Maricaulis sp. W15]OLF81253.1 hypothetical protein AWH62_00840 [Maricaulis sp. W15]
MTPQERATESCAGHVVQTDQSTCFRFSTPEKSAYWFFVCWVPGHIFIGGDIGTITFVHYQAFQSMRSAMDWLSGGDDTYQLEKSNASMAIDVDKTRAQLKVFEREAEEYGEPTEEFRELFSQCFRGNEPSIPGVLAAAKCVEDYCGTEDYGWQSRFQIACARLAAKAWLAANPACVDERGAS